MLKKELLEILCCPKCKGDLDYDEPASRLTCKRCNHQYRVENGIPIMLIDDETKSSKDIS